MVPQCIRHLRTAMEPLEGNMANSPKFEDMYTRQERIATLAKQSQKRAFLSLNHYLDLHWLKTAFERTRKDGAVGIDGGAGSGHR